MKTPQQGQPMEQAVFPVAPKVKEQKSQQQLCNGGKRQPCKHARWLIQRKGINSDRYHKTGDDAANQKQANIARPPLHDLNGLALKGANPFQQNKQRHSGEKNEPIQRLEFFSHRKLL
ncbi:MAG: hypothetical protein ACYCZ6_09785 [Polaromonas sp.]